jgi:hypothetical protein
MGRDHLQELGAYGKIILTSIFRDMVYGDIDWKYMVQNRQALMKMEVTLRVP